MADEFRDKTTAPNQLLQTDFTYLKIVGGAGTISRPCSTTPLDAYFADHGIRRIGLLGTRVVMRTRLYGQLIRTEALALETEIETLGQMYQEVAVGGTCSTTQRDAFLNAGRRMIAAGAEAIVLAGTDLNLVFDGQDPGYRVIDALDVHVEILADLATDRIALEDAALG